MSFAAKLGRVSPVTLCDIAHAPRTARRRVDASSLTPVHRTEVQARAATWPLTATDSLENDTTIPVAKELSVGSLVLVAGSTGGVGQLAVQRLLENGFRVRAATRDIAKAEEIFGTSTPNLEIVACDMRYADGIPAIMEGVDAVCSCVGTTAFPSPRWKGDNSPEQTDKIAIANLIQHTPRDIGRFILVSSAGVTRTDQFPFVILNLFNVLTYKRGVEKSVMSSGLPWTILRPSRLTDAPYTSKDLNSLIKGTRGNRLAVRVSAEDNLYGEASRIDVAEAIVQCLHLPDTTHHCFALESIDGDNPPEKDTNKWSQLFSSCS